MELIKEIGIYLEIEHFINEVYQDIKIACEKVESGMFVIREVHIPDENIPYLEYTIELIRRDNLDTDDYGVVLCLNIENIGTSIRIKLDVTRSFGEILTEKDYMLNSNKDLLFSKYQLSNILQEIKSISKQLFSYTKE